MRISDWISDVCSSDLEAAILAPLAERHNDYVAFLAALGEEITMARGIVFVGLDPKYPMLHQLFQSRREDVPDQAQRPVKFPEMLEPDERRADDEQRPPRTDPPGGSGDTQ